MLELSDGGTAIGKISVRDTNRIAVAGGRIAEVWGSADTFTADKDEQVGQVFLRVPSPAQREAISLFVTDDQGKTYTLILTPADIPAETVMIRRRGDDRRSASAWERSDTYVGALRRIIKSMTKDEIPDGYQVSERDAVVPLWDEARLRLDREYLGGVFTGETYTLTNMTAVDLATEEREFYRPGVAAVAIERHLLAPGQSTRVYVVRRGGGDE